MKLLNFKNKNGITLIALVITIIVMLILAAISLTMLTGDNSILQRAIEAKEKTRDETQKEALDLAILGVLSNPLGNDEITKQNLEDELNKSSEAGNFEITESGSYVIVSFTKGKTYRVSKSGETDNYSTSEETIASVESPEDADIRIKLSISGTRVTTPPMPSGFRHTTGSISDGYVITDGTNEFVWIPVDQNQKIKLEVTANENISSIKLYHPDGTPTSYTATGTSYENATIDPTTNGVYIATTYTETGKAAVKVLQVYSLYSHIITQIREDTLSSFGFSSIEQAEQQFEGYKTNVDVEMGNFFQSVTNNSGYVDMIDYSSSVEANGGFYIGRYEIGATKYRTSGNSNATVSDIISTNGKSICGANQIPYINITLSQARGLAESMYVRKGFTCSLLTGSAWERTLAFLQEEGSNNKTSSELYTNCKNWGNYEDADYTVANTNARYKIMTESSTNPFYSIETSYLKEAGSQILFTTGATERNTAKNIYDLAGNLGEWILEKDSTDSSVIVRGGAYLSNGITVIDRFKTEADYAHNSIGFRPALYL